LVDLGRDIPGGQDLDFPRDFHEAVIGDVGIFLRGLRNALGHELVHHSINVIFQVFFLRENHPGPASTPFNTLRCTVPVRKRRDAGRNPEWQAEAGGAEQLNRSDENVGAEATSSLELRRVKYAWKKGLGGVSRREEYAISPIFALKQGYTRETPRPVGQPESLRKCPINRVQRANAWRTAPPYRVATVRARNPLQFLMVPIPARPVRMTSPSFPQPHPDPVI